MKREARVNENEEDYIESSRPAHSSLFFKILIWLSFSPIKIHEAVISHVVMSLRAGL